MARPLTIPLVCIEVLSVTSLIHVCVQMINMWLDLKSFLNSLGAMPLVSSFLARARVRSNRPIWVQNLNLQSLSTLVRSPTILHDIALKQDGIKELYEDYRTRSGACSTNPSTANLSQTNSLRPRRRSSNPPRKRPVPFHRTMLVWRS